MQYQIILPNGKTYQETAEKPYTGEELLKKYQNECPYSILGMRVDQKERRLDTLLDEDCIVELLDLRDSDTNMSYQMTLTLLYTKAVHDVLGKEVRITIANSLSKGLFTKIRTPVINEELVCNIQNRMEQLVKENVPVKQVKKDRFALLKMMEKKDNHPLTSLFESAYDLQEGYLSTIEDEEGVFYQCLLPTTGYLKWFEVKCYRTGLILRFPYQYEPDQVPSYLEQKLLYEAFSEETHWNRLLGLDDAAALNEKVKNGKIREMVLLSEALHEKRIAEIAEMIHTQRKRIVLIAGPSSSGKTTFAKRLCIQLQVCGLKPLYLGTDDYFVNRALVPEGPDGKQDLEGIGAVDTKLFAEQMNALLSGKKVDIPSYNFIKGEKEFGNRITSVENGQPIVIEGIHALNPLMTEGIPENEKFRIYISPLTQLNIDPYHRIPTTDVRLLRRMVRDYRTRGSSAAHTLHAWPSVRQGEEKNIFPFNAQADVFFNTECSYEIPVLKKYAEPLLKNIGMHEKEYAEAQRMLRFLAFFVPLEDDSCIPNNSVIREFIGGSVIV